MKNSVFKTNELTQDRIKKITIKILENYFAECKVPLSNFLRIDLEEIYQYVLYPEYEYRIIKDQDLGDIDDAKILGKTINEEKVILIDKSLSPVKKRDPRYVFTLGHEFGHSVLHSSKKPLFKCTDRNIYTDQKDDLLETQANWFAEHLIMPDLLVKMKFQEYFNIRRPVRYIGSSRYCITFMNSTYNYDVKTYTSLCKAYAKFLTSTFSDVSIESMALKLHKLGLVKNEIDENFIVGEVIRGRGFHKLGSRI